MVEENTPAKNNYSWGKDYHGTNYSDTLHCTNDTCTRSRVQGKYMSLEYEIEIAIGVRKEGNRKAEHLRPYILACECPSCFDKFWFHINEHEAEEIFKQRVEKR